MITLIALFLGGVGTLMQPTAEQTSSPPVVTYRITTESDNVITTEAGDALRTETP